MMTIPIRKVIALAAVLAVAGIAFAAQDIYGMTGTAKDKKTVAINLIIASEADAEVDITVEKVTKKRTSSLTRTVTLKKGMNYFTYNRGKKGYYRVTIAAYGDDMVQGVMAVKGAYTLYYTVAPPKDGDAKKSAPPAYQDLALIKQKK